MEKEVVLEGEGIQQVIEEVTLDINNGNEKFVRITDEEMPEILKFMEEQNNFSEWAFIGQGQRSTEEETEPEKEGENAGVPPSLSSSVFLRNFEEQMRLVRQEREEKWKLQQSMLEVPSEDQVVGNAGWAMIPPDPVGNEQIGLDQQTPGDSASAHCVQTDGDVGEPLVPLENLKWKTDSNIFKFVKQDDQDLLSEWVWIEDLKNDTTVCKQIVVKEGNICVRPSFFANWPSFGVYDKMKVVVTATGTAFCFGFVMGAQMAMQSIFRLLKTPMVAGGVGLAAALGVYLQPTFVVTAIEYVVLGGVLFGTSVAVPVFVVGTGGVFVGASIYHAFIAAKRGVTRAMGGGSSSCCQQPQIKDKSN